MRPRVGVSACLLGERVRYDGGHKLQPRLVEALRDQVEWVPVCPEVEIGLGVPRETIQLEAAPSGDVRLVSSETRRDLTQAMRDWAALRLDALVPTGLDGYLFKARSPSCGLGSTPVAGRPETRDGLFAETVRARLPHLPVSDEEGVSDRAGRRRFLRLAGAHRELRELFHPGWARGDVVDFHTHRKLLLMAYSPELYAKLGRLVATELASPDFQQQYVAEFLAAIAEDPTPGRHANALAHAAGYFPPEAALTAAIERIGSGEVSQLDAVKACILARAREHGEEYLARQQYLWEREAG
jgi:uncharacterized protein YbbK (DUF523 family)/uncharacterized protein YbgA (DUF1722 family)